MIEIEMASVGFHAAHFEEIEMALDKFRYVFSVGNEAMLDKT